VSNSGFFYASTSAITDHWVNGATCAEEPESWSSPTIAGEAVSCKRTCAGSKRESLDCVWADGDHRWPGTPGFRGSNGYCVSQLQAASMPEQTLCIAPDQSQEHWGSRLMFEFFDSAGK